MTRCEQESINEQDWGGYYSSQGESGFNDTSRNNEKWSDSGQAWGWYYITCYELKEVK